MQIEINGLLLEKEIANCENANTCNGCYFQENPHIEGCNPNLCSDYKGCEIQEMYIFKFISGKIGAFDNQKIEKEIEIQENKITERMLKGRSVGGTAGALNRDIDNMGKKLDNLKSRLNLQTALSFYHEP